MIIRHYDAIEAVNNGTDEPDSYFDGSQLMATTEYVRIDGWRGYTKIIPADGYKELNADWVTGDWSDAPAGHAASDVVTEIEALEKKHGTIHVIFTPTSNVFSTSYTVLVRDDTKKPDNGKPYGHRTRKFEKPDGSYSIRYWKTHVVKFNARKNSYTLDSGGWLTPTTKKRINAELPQGYGVRQKDFEWFVDTPDGVKQFEDGMEVVIA